ncbi:MAG: hypothetical protein WC455_12065, partial [Dehalococcoidia bacterium]
MCQPASGVLTKDHAFWSKKTESHSEIIQEFNLHADGVGGPNVLQFEITPPNGDFTKPLEEWRYRVDQDVTPEWYDPAKDETRARSILQDWIAAKVVLPGQIRVVNRGEMVIACYGTVQYVNQGGTVQDVNQGGTVQDVNQGGMVQYVNQGGTVQYVNQGGTVQYVNGTVQYVNGT